MAVTTWQVTLLLIGPRARKVGPFSATFRRISWAVFVYAFRLVALTSIFVVRVLKRGERGRDVTAGVMPNSIDLPPREGNRALDDIDSGRLQSATSFPF